MSNKLRDQVNCIRLVLQQADDSISTLIEGFQQKPKPLCKSKKGPNEGGNQLIRCQEQKTTKNGSINLFATPLKEMQDQREKIKDQLLRKNHKVDEVLVKQETALQYLQKLGSRIRTVKEQSRQITKNTTRLPEIRKTDDEVHKTQQNIDEFELTGTENNPNFMDAMSDDCIIGNYEQKKIQVKGLNRKYSEVESFNGTQSSYKDSCSSLSSNSSGIHHYQSNKTSTLLKLFSCSLQPEDEEQNSKSSKNAFESQTNLPFIDIESQTMLPLIAIDSQKSLPLISIEPQTKLPLISIQSQATLPLINQSYLSSNDSAISQEGLNKYRKSKFSPIFQQATEISLFNTSQTQSPSSNKNMVMSTQSLKIFDQYNHSQNHSNALKREDFDNNRYLIPQSSVMQQTAISHQKYKSTMNCQVTNNRLISPSTNIKQYYGQEPAITRSSMNLDQYLLPQRQPLNQEKNNRIQKQGSIQLKNGRIQQVPSFGSNGGAKFQLKLSEIKFEDEELSLKLHSEGYSCSSNQGESSNCAQYVDRDSPFLTDEYNLSPQSFGHTPQQHSNLDYLPSNSISFIDSRSPIVKLSEVQSSDENHLNNKNFSAAKKAQPSTFGDYVALQGSIERPRSLEYRRINYVNNRSKLQSIKISLQDLAKDLDCKQYDGSFTSTSTQRQKNHDKASTSNFKISLQRAN